MTRELTYSSHPQVLSDIRKQVGEVAQWAGLSPEEVHDVKLAVNEAVANIIEHAYEWREDGRIIVRITASKGRIEIRLRDFGRKVDVDCIQPRELEDYREGGIGVFLMKSLMDEVCYDTSHEVGTELVLVKRHREPEKSRSMQTGHEVGAG